MCAMPGRVMSSMYRPCPVIRRGSSRRWILAPIMVVTAMSAPSCGGLRGGFCRRAAHGGGRRLHRLDDVHVARAATEVALETLPDLVIGRVRVLREEVGRGHDEAGGAVAALQAVLVPERLLQRVELAVLGHALDRGEVPALGLDGEHRAALHRLAVDEDRAGAALAGVTSDVGSGEPGNIADVMHEQEPRLDLMLVPVAIDGGGDLVLHLRPPSSQKGAQRARRDVKRVESGPSIRLLLEPKCN